MLADLPFTVVVLTVAVEAVRQLVTQYGPDCAVVQRSATRNTTVRTVVKVDKVVRRMSSVLDLVTC